MRDAISKPQPPAPAEFTTSHMRLIKIGARITEAANRIRVTVAAETTKQRYSSVEAAVSAPPSPDARGKRPELALQP